MSEVRIAILQTNPRFGAFAENVSAILNSAEVAAAEGATIAITPAFALTGFTGEDVAARATFLADAQAALEQLASELDRRFPQMHLLVGTITPAPAAASDQRPRIAAAYLHGGTVGSIVEQGTILATASHGHNRVFSSGSGPALVEVAGVGLYVVIGDDAATPAAVAPAGARATVVLAADPFSPAALQRREAAAAHLQAQAQGSPVFYANLVGGQDDLVFDGGSFATPNIHGPQFVSDVLVAKLSGADLEPITALGPRLEAIAQIYDATVLGLGDYVRKSGFTKVILGLSGGIDSALVAAIGADAVGGSNIIGVSMPSAISSDHSIADAASTAQRLGLDYRTQPIAPLVDAFQAQLNLTGIAYENLQARMRGVILMAISNSEGGLVLATGNKSEGAMGYSTIYGDAVGGYAPIKDVPKTLVWELSRFRNARARAHGSVEPIPENSITKPPSAELSPGQRDDLTLPPYDQLDAILEVYLGEQVGRNELLGRGFEEKAVDQVLRLVDRGEWKRRQYPLGPKVSETALGRDRKLPVMNSYTEQS